MHAAAPAARHAAAPSLPREAVTAGAVAGNDVITQLGMTAEIELLRERIGQWLELVSDELREPLAWAFAGAPKHFRPATLFACRRGVGATSAGAAVDYAFAMERMH